MGSGVELEWLGILQDWEWDMGFFPLGDTALSQPQGRRERDTGLSPLEGAGSDLAPGWIIGYGPLSKQRGSDMGRPGSGARLASGITPGADGAVETRPFKISAKQTFT